MILESPQSHRLLQAAAHAAWHSWRRWLPGRLRSDSRNTSSGSSCEPVLACRRRPCHDDRDDKAAGTSGLPRPARPTLSTWTSRLRSAWSRGRCGRTQDPRLLRSGHTRHQAFRRAEIAAGVFGSCCNPASTRRASGESRPLSGAATRLLHAAREVERRRATVRAGEVLRADRVVRREQG
jgi:hypothetical protein